MTITEGDRRKDQGVDEVLAAATAGHRIEIRDALAAIVVEMARSGRAFTAEAVREAHDRRGGAAPHSPNVIPAIIRTASRRDLIRQCGFTAASRASRHGGALRIWRGAPHVIASRQARRDQLGLWDTPG